MLLWSWVIRAVRPCCLSFKCSQPDSSFPYCVMVVKVFKGESSILRLQRELQIRTFARSWRVYRKKGISLQTLPHCPNHNSHLFGSSVPGCSSACPQRGPAGRYSCSRQLLLRPEKGSALPCQRYIAPTPLWASACGCLGRSLRVWSGKTFLHHVFNCHLIWV